MTTRAIEPTPFGMTYSEGSVESDGGLRPEVSLQHQYPMAKTKVPWERFGPIELDFKPLTVRGIELQVTRLPAYANVNGHLVFPPFSALQALEYGDAHGLALPTASVLDAVRAAGWYHPPITGFYDPAGDMQSDAVVIELGRRWSRAMTDGGYNGEDFVPNATKAWIADGVALKKPGYGVNRGYWMTEGAKYPIQLKGQAHFASNSDLAQGGWFVKATPEYITAIETGALGDEPFSYSAFEAATRKGALSGIQEQFQSAWSRFLSWFWGGGPKLSIHAWKGSELWSDGQIQRLVRIADAAGVNPADVLLVHLSETGGGAPEHWVNRAQDGHVQAAGMLQYTKETAGRLGYDLETLASAGIGTQLDALEKYLQRFWKGRGARDAADLYLLNFGQKRAVKGERAYDLNVAYLDRDKDDDIDRDDMVALLSQKKRELWDSRPMRMVG